MLFALFCLFGDAEKSHREDTSFILPPENHAAPGGRRKGNTVQCPSVTGVPRRQLSFFLFHLPGQDRCIFLCLVHHNTAPLIILIQVIFIKPPETQRRAAKCGGSSPHRRGLRISVNTCQCSPLDTIAHKSHAVVSHVRLNAGIQAHI